MIVILKYGDPAIANWVEEVIGPFSSYEEAREWRDTEHPREPMFWVIRSVTDPVGS